MLNYDLQNREYENVALQAQRDVYQAQLEKFQGQVRDLIINRHVLRVNDPGKDNIVMIIEKNTVSLLYYENTATVYQRKKKMV